MSAKLDADIRKVFSEIYDPCSIAAGRPISLLDMGLVLGWTLEDGHLIVTMCTTFAGCTMAPKFTEEAEPKLAVLENVTSAAVIIDPTFFWTPDRMSEPDKASPPAKIVAEHQL